MKNRVKQTVCERIFVGQVANLPPIGNRRATAARNGACALGDGFSTLSVGPPKSLGALRSVTASFP
jgi:hypothetical protein